MAKLLERREYTDTLLDHDPKQYVTLAVYKGDGSSVSLVSDNQGRVVVFDNMQLARDFMPLMKEFPYMEIPETWGIHWNSSFDEATWIPLDLTLSMYKAPRVSILTGYDIYNLPPNHPVKSETRFMSWKNHVIWSQWLQTLDFVQPSY